MHPLTLSTCVFLLAMSPILSSIELRPVLPLSHHGPLGTLPMIETAEGQPVDWGLLPPVWQEERAEIAVTLRAGWSEAGVHLQCTVRDPSQDNPFSGRDLWRGDCIYLSLAALGEPDHPESGGESLHPDHLTILLGLGAEGAECRLSGSGNPLLGPDATLQPSPWLHSILRHEESQTTTYTLTVPWQALGSAPGMAERVGMAAIVAHKDASGRDLAWGRVRASAEGPRSLHFFAYETDPAPFLRLAAVRPFALGGDAAVVRLCWRLPASTSISLLLASEDGATRSLVQALELSADPNPQRLDLVLPQHWVDSHPLLQASSGQGSPAIHPPIRLFTARSEYDRLERKVAALKESSAHPEARHHFASTLAVLRDARVRLDLQGREGESRMMVVANRLRQLLPDDGFDFSRQLEHGLPLVQAFVSRADQTLQFYSLQFPYGWQEDKTYPLTIYLHGMGSEHPIDGLLNCFDNSGQDTLFTYDPIDPQNVPPAQRGFVLAPWARGNSFYEGTAALDLWQALREVEARFRIDPDRRYLTGFSMGSYGALRLASLRPDLWAAVNLASGFWPAQLTSARLGNIASLPFFMHAGELEPRFVEGGQRVSGIFSEHGITHRFSVLERMPHTYPHPLFQEVVGLMMDLSRTRPREFSYVAESYLNPGIWGITLDLPFIGWPEDPPRFTCTVEGQVVRLQTHGVPALRVDLGPNGLDLPSGVPVRVFWNGQESYLGEPALIFLGPSFQRYGGFD